jgi:hypothetical protein
MIAWRKVWRFKVLLWAGMALVVAWLLGWPLGMNAWAGARWRQTPCHAIKEGVFYYRVDNVKYMSTRRDFWTVQTVTEKARVETMLENNDVCWVNPADPLDAVLRLDAPRRWDRAMNRLGIAAMLLATAGMLTLWDPVKRAQAARGSA